MLKKLLAMLAIVSLLGLTTGCPGDKDKDKKPAKDKMTKDAKVKDTGRTRSRTPTRTM